MKAYRVHEYGKAAKFIEDEINKPKVKKRACCDWGKSLKP